MASERTSLRDQLIPGKYRAFGDELSAGTLEARLSDKGAMSYWRLDVRPKTYRPRNGARPKEGQRFRRAGAQNSPILHG